MARQQELWEKQGCGSVTVLSMRGHTTKKKKTHEQASTQLGTHKECKQKWLQQRSLEGRYSGSGAPDTLEALGW